MGRFTRLSLYKLSLEKRVLTQHSIAFHFLCFGFQALIEGAALEFGVFYLLLVYIEVALLLAHQSLP